MITITAQGLSPAEFNRKALAYNANLRKVRATRALIAEEFARLSQTPEEFLGVRHDKAQARRFTGAPPSGFVSL